MNCICIPKALPTHLQIDAAVRAISQNPANRPNMAGLRRLLPSSPVMEPAHLALLTTKYWGAGGVKLTVGFMDQVGADLAQRIVSHMNAWAKYCNATFRLISQASSAQVRVSLAKGGYWSYLGTDILSSPRNQQTMNLEGFTMNMPESEFVRVIRHETGHTLGFPHEHLRRELVARLDPQKTIAYFQRTQGWSSQEVQAQVLTPLDESSLMGTPHADSSSIMCYQLPAQITVDGQPIIGGTDIDDNDKGFAAKIYPLAAPPVTPPPPPPPSGVKFPLIVAADGTWKASANATEGTW